MMDGPAGISGGGGVGSKLYREVCRRLFRIWDASPGKMPSTLPVYFLRAASGIYGIGLRADQRRALKERARLSAFVISIGNLVAGGTGKTPVTLWMSRFLTERGFHPAILSRGYGKKVKGPVQVSAAGDPCAQSELYGDEPVLMAKALQTVPVWVGSKRVLSGRAALSGPAMVDTLVLDDGFQHLSLYRDLDLVLLDSGKPFGNGFTLPLGPLREPLSSLERASAIIITRAGSGPELAQLKLRLEDLAPGKPAFACNHRITGFRNARDDSALSVASLKGRKVVAFAGIARPEAFFRSLSRLGIETCAVFTFPDHYRYARPDLASIMESVSHLGAEFLVTTAKDAMRVPPGYGRNLTIAEMEIDFGPDEKRFCEFLCNCLTRYSASPKFV